MLRGVILKKKIIKISIIIIVLAIIASTIFFCTREKPDYSGITIKVASSIDLAGGSYLEGAKKFEEDFGCKVEFTNTFEGSDLFYSSGEDFSQCMPINDYINPKNRLYTKEIMDQSCTQNGNIYGVSHVLLGKINYCAYDPSQFGDVTLPYDYYKNGIWNWDNFIDMTDKIDSNVKIDWNSSYINMMHSLFLDENGNPTFDYGTQDQIEWLNFIRALIYDRGIAEMQEGSYEVGFLPQLVLDRTEATSQMRYIPWPTKNGDLGTIFVDEYHFCVPKTAENPDLSIELANYMIKSCINTRTSLYKENMTKEDYKLFKKQIKNIYCYPQHSDYVPSSEFIADFVRGKTVTEHIYNVQNDAEHIN